MSAVFLRLAGMSVTGGLVVLAVILLRAVFRRAPKWLICALWAAAALRLALPFSLQSGASLMPRSEKVEIAGAGEVAVLRTGVLTVNSLVDRALLVSGSSEYAPPEEAAEQGAQAGEIAGEARLTGEAVVKTGSATALEIVSYIWAAGAAGLLLYAALSTLRLKRRLAASLPEGGGIYRCDGIKSPFVFGIIRPRIYLPSSLPDERLAPVLAHERAHIARGDNIRRLLGCVVLAAHWMNPLVWLGFALFCRDIEAACDERVIKDMDREARADYSEALLALSAPKGFEFACPAAFGETGVKWRIKNVLNFKKPAFWLIALAAAAGCALAVCCLTDPKPSEPAECYRVLSDGSTLRVFMDSKAEAEIGAAVAKSRFKNAPSDWDESYRIIIGGREYGYSPVSGRLRERSAGKEAALSEKKNGRLKELLGLGAFTAVSPAGEGFKYVFEPLCLDLSEDGHGPRLWAEYRDPGSEEEGYAPDNCTLYREEANGALTPIPLERPVYFGGGYSWRGSFVKEVDLSSADLSREGVYRLCFYADHFSDERGVKEPPEPSECYVAFRVGGERTSVWLSDDERTLCEKKPQFFGLDAEKGLDVYVSSFGQYAYNCMILPHADEEPSVLELSRLELEKGFLSISETRTVLASYGVKPEDVHIRFYQNYLSSYLPSAPREDIEAKVRKLLFEQDGN